jgi:GT2 family glycosyltransferase
MVVEITMPTVCISILNWNNADETLKCIDSLKNIQNIRCKIVVLDNGSSDDSVKKLSSLKNVVLITSAINLGFSAGHNLIVRHALSHACDYVWLLNNDATIESRCLEKLVAWSECHPEAGMVSPVVKDSTPPYALQHVLTLLNTTRTGVEEFPDVDEAQALQNEQPARVILWGTGLLIRRTTIEKVGLLDEHLFAYSEDTDYSLRCIQAGLLNQVVFDASIFHHRPTGFRKPHYYYYTHRNAFLTWRKYVGLKDLVRLTRWNLRLAKRQIAEMKQENILVDSLKLGIWHGWMNRGGSYRSGERLGFMAEFLVDFLLTIA